MEQEGGDGGEGGDMNKKQKQLVGMGDAKAAAQVAVKCPRCDSMNTKFCYYNNYSLSQPRYFCKACRRYWTHGGSLRNVPVGGGSRKPKRPKLATNHSSEATAVVGVPTPPPPPVSSVVTPFFQGAVGGFLPSSLGGIHHHHDVGGSGFNVGSYHHPHVYEQQGLMRNENYRAPLINPDGSLWSTMMSTTTQSNNNNNNSSGASSSAAAAAAAAAFSLMQNQWPGNVTGFGPPPPSF